MQFKTKRDEQNFENDLKTLREYCKSKEKALERLKRSRKESMTKNKGDAGKTPPE